LGSSGSPFVTWKYFVWVLQVTQVSKRSAEMWRTLPVEERAYWDDVAAKDKARYMAEKATYTGPWQVPWKRAKKV
jgi:hypothetical protein